LRAFLKETHQRCGWSLSWPHLRSIPGRKEVCSPVLPQYRQGQGLAAGEEEGGLQSLRKPKGPASDKTVCHITQWWRKGSRQLFPKALNTREVLAP